MFSLAKRIIKQIIHDKRSLAMILIAPILLTTLLYLLLSESNYIPVIAIDETQFPPVIISELNANEKISLIDKDKTISDEDFIKDNQADAVINMGASGIQIAMFELDSVKTAKVIDALNSALSKMNPQTQLEMNYIYGDTEASTFDSLAFLLLSVLAFFFVFMVAGISFVRERTTQTLERLMRTPIRTVSIVSGYSIGFGFFAILQSILLILFTRFVLNTPFVGDWWIATVIMLLIAIVAVMCGILVSVVSKTEFQVVQFIPILVIPQIFFSGLIPVDTLPYHLDLLSIIMPLYYGGLSLKGVMVYGYGFAEIMPQIYVLLGMITLLFLINIFAVSRYRRS